MKIFIGTDHAGFELKEELKRFLEDSGCEVKDLGAYEFNDTDDYPDFIFPVVEAVAKDIARGLDSRGIVIGGSGQGEAIVANKVKSIRAAVVYDEYSAKMSREHNDANIISLGSRTLDISKAKQLVKLWLETPFSNEERHIRRIEKIKAIEGNNFKIHV
ncbi:MAG: ribose-5-phosphate isomerase [Candidatus Brocadiaceae bacterium]|nr:ribose-5-phosphate isomerase [Candidatus Brocadiaceae bacterium]